jgi:Gpi18-like mannosyltransferase
MNLRPITRTALLAAISSRALLYALLIFGSQLAFLQKVHSNSAWETRMEFRSERLLPELIRISMPGDSWWYRSIALQGYGPRADANGVPNYAFFPLYPLLVRYAGPTRDFALDGLIFSNAAFAVALVLLGFLGMRAGLTEDESQRAILFLAFFPTSYFCSMPLTESLFLMLSLACLLAGYSGRWGIASAFGALAALTRLAGGLLLLPLAILFYRQERRISPRCAWFLLIPAATSTFLIYLHSLTGNWRAFLVTQERWGRSPGFFWTPLWNYVKDPALVSEPWNLIAMNFAFALLLLVAGIALLLRKKWELGAYTLASLLLPLSTGSLQSLGRYAVVVFPLFLWLGMLARRPVVERIVFAVLITLFGWLVAMFTLRVDFALA